MVRSLIMLAAATVLCPSVARCAGWIAFVAVDIPQTHRVFDEFTRRVAVDPKARGLETRFIAMSPANDPLNREELAKAIAAGPTVIVAASARDALYAKGITTSIPVIFASVADPVRLGLVESLGAPGGNLTGFTYAVEIEGKQLELLAELAPTSKVFGVLEDGHWLEERITPAQLARYETRLGRTVRVFRGSTVEELVRIVEKESTHVDGWLVPLGNVAAEGRTAIIRALRGSRKPTVFGRTFFVQAGGLASYQETIDDPVELWIGLLQNVLKGIPPARIPVQRPKRFEMALNIEEAERIGLSIPKALLRRADRVFPK